MIKLRSYEIQPAFTAGGPEGVLIVLISAVFIEIYDTDMRICGCGKNTFDDTVMDEYDHFFSHG